MDDTCQWFAGIDWASTAHQVGLLDARGKPMAERAFEHGGEGLAALCDWLVERSGTTPGRIAVAIETPHGPVVETLLERGFKVHAINPKQLDRFRDRHTVAGAKDDRRDARVLADALRTDPHCFRQLEVSAPLLVELREWSRAAEELQQERTRLSNRIRQQLWRYYPQVLELGDDIAADWLLDLWELAPRPADAQLLRPARVARVLTKHRIRRIGPSEALDILRKPAVTVAPGTAEAAVARIRLLAARVRLVNTQLREAQGRLDVLCDQAAGSEASQGAPTDAAILRSLPGVGRIVLAVLLSEAAEPLARRDNDALRNLCGVAPVTRRSGKRLVVSMRRAPHVRLRLALYHWSRVAIQRDPASRSRYAALRERGHSHPRALRSVADRLLSVACAMLRTGTLFRSDLQQKAAATA
ncbi:IS110 family transposase [Roseomonas sp. E05]|uniref:IS110 family transposase n=1 Tax=Roseomonas sp. E05 TaxID=3046310 RepID=UPI0024B9F4DE|nr:IS110 family transposase [Roseomonas sp. E05]MDJ0390237.1 IS110 family transposase [Roseomonas sp. E05]